MSDPKWIWIAVGAMVLGLVLVAMDVFVSLLISIVGGLISGVMVVWYSHDRMRRQEVRRSVENRALELLVDGTDGTDGLYTQNWATGLHGLRNEVVWPVVDEMVALACSDSKYEPDRYSNVFELEFEERLKDKYGRYMEALQEAAGPQPQPDQYIVVTNQSERFNKAMARLLLREARLKFYADRCREWLDKYGRPSPSL